MLFGLGTVQWIAYLQYLVYLWSGRDFSVNVDANRQTFLDACNKTQSKAKESDELLHLELKESYCLSWFHSNTFEWWASAGTLVYSSVFRFGNICGIVRLELRHIRLLQHVNFFEHFSELYVVRPFNVRLTIIYWAISRHMIYADFRFSFVLLRSIFVLSSDVKKVSIIAIKHL